MSPTGHAHHFLSRLDRLSLPHVELALSLYRDEALVRAILSRANVPEQIERAALSLDDRERGPFLVVTRDGKFVTCLGEGMSAGKLLVVPRSKLDVVSEEVSVLREHAETLKQTPSRLSELIAELFAHSPSLSREQFQSLARWQPLLPGKFLKWLADITKDVEQTRAFLLAELRRTDKLHSRFDDLLNVYWRNMWAVGHLSVLGAMSGTEPLADVSHPARAGFFSTPFSMLAVSQTLVGIAMRGLWGAARLGKEQLPAYKRACENATTLAEVLNGAFGLAMFGFRHSRLRAEVKKALAVDASRGVWPFAVAMREKLLEVFALEERYPEATYAQYAHYGGALMIENARRLPAASPFRYKKPEDVPAELALRIMLYDPADFLREREAVLVMLIALPWLSRASAEDLYLPAEYAEAFRTPYEPERVLDMLRRERDTERAIREEAAKNKAAEPSRGGPCPCGSGKKYKRCCGAEKR